VVYSSVIGRIRLRVQEENFVFGSVNFLIGSHSASVTNPQVASGVHGNFPDFLHIRSTYYRSEKERKELTDDLHKLKGDNEALKTQLSGLELQLAELMGSSKSKMEDSLVEDEEDNDARKKVRCSAVL
jgi:hypothetical protein